MTRPIPPQTTEQIRKSKARIKAALKRGMG